jgi:hypothetical protein
MATERLSITLPKDVVKRIRQEARKTGRPVSGVIAAALVEHEREVLRRRMIEGYKAAAQEEETRRITEDFESIAAETWPEE